ncbi:MAG: UDP-N-acetylmuramoyl-tripeptide--D-alanyl-D-alanine ligase [Patescibacteria group bacterium]
MKSFLKDILVAILEFEARAVLKKYRPTIIAITGSVGKTSTKDAIYSVLSRTGHVRKSEKSFNSEIGVPLTILGCQNAWSNPVLWLKNIFQGLELIFFKSTYPDCLVLEVGADKPSDISNLAEWLKPHIVVITKVSDVPVHVEFFPSAEALLKEKAFLVKSLRKDGTLVLYADDAKVLSLGKGMSQKIITFGMTNSATITGTNDSIVYESGRPVGISFKLNYEGNSVPVVIKGVLGSHHIYPLIAAASVALARKVPLSEIVSKLSEHVAPKGRMNIIKGINDSILIDDTYNSSPDALQEALNTLSKVETSGKKIAVLGDMLELGKFSVEEHKKAGERASQVASLVVSVGQRSKEMPGVSASFESSLQALDFLKDKVGQGDLVLVKGSQSIRMEHIVKGLMLEPEKAYELLVRQEPEWLAKK